MACVRTRTCHIYRHKQASNVTAARWIVVLVRVSPAAASFGARARAARRIYVVYHLPIRLCICTGQWRQKSIDGDGSVADAPAVCCLTFEFKRREIDHASITKASKKKPFLLKCEDLVDVLFNSAS